MKQSKMRIFQLLFLVFLVVGTIFIIRNNYTRSAVYQSHKNGAIFGTFYNITYQGDTDLEDSIRAQLMRVDASLSPFNDSSVISRINRNEAVQTDTMFRRVFRLAEEVSAQTGGAFDITVAPLVNAWGFGFKQGSSVDARVVDSLRAFVGFHKVKLADGRVVKQDSRTMLDCSAIAKGYGSDVVAAFLDRKGIRNYMIEIGGEIVLRGNSPKGRPWRIGINRPVDDSTSMDGGVVATIDTTNTAMATSGNYRNFYYKDGKKYAHTIDPHTGYPVQHSVLSATVLAPDCATADAYATAFMVLGLDGAKKVLGEHPELQAYLIYTDEKGEQRTFFSPNLNKNIVDLFKNN